MPKPSSSLFCSLRCTLPSPTPRGISRPIQGMHLFVLLDKGIIGRRTNRQWCRLDRSLHIRLPPYVVPFVFCCLDSRDGRPAHGRELRTTHFECRLCVSLKRAGGADLLNDIQKARCLGEGQRRLSPFDGISKADNTASSVSRTPSRGAMSRRCRSTARAAYSFFFFFCAVCFSSGGKRVHKGAVAAAAVLLAFSEIVIGRPASPPLVCLPTPRVARVTLKGRQGCARQWRVRCVEGGFEGYRGRGVGRRGGSD